MLWPPSLPRTTGHRVIVRSALDADRGRWSSWSGWRCRRCRRCRRRRRRRGADRDPFGVRRARRDHRDVVHPAPHLQRRPLGKSPAQHRPRPLNGSRGMRRVVGDFAIRGGGARVVARWCPSCAVHLGVAGRPHRPNLACLRLRPAPVSLTPPSQAHAAATDNTTALTNQSGTPTSTPFWTIFEGHLSSVHPHTCRTMRSARRPC